ncbi:MAG: ATP synthase F1 subunit gamma [Oscillospiraceae bacterium]|jgi:F-type H+-transporting ATPase subunit gamma|nr:ATP synthase F1 subunit gamma [Oscillospiraceae bacterium]
MASPNEIRRHISAVEQTMKITGAMEMVSSNRMRRVMGHIEHNRRYFSNIRRAMKEVLSTSQSISHPYLSERETGGRAFVVISGDKGLCGSYNASILGMARERILACPDHFIITIGNTAEEYFTRQGMHPDISFLGIVQDPTLHNARRLSREVMSMFDSGMISELHVVYTSFYGATRNKPVDFRLLPIILHDYSDVTDTETLSEMEYHMPPQALFDMLVPQYVLGLMFGVMVQAYASEHYARMNAMRSSTENARDMLKELRTQYNLARQSAITNEIAEITGSAEILRGGDGHGS